MKLKGWLVALSFCFAGHSAAMTVEYDLLNPVEVVGETNIYAEELHYEQAGVGLTVTGWSNGGDRYRPFSAFEQAYVGQYNNGLGVEKRRGRRSNIDNLGMDFDFLMLEFDQEVELESVSLGFIPRNADTDMSIGTLDDYGIWAVDNIYDADLGANAANPSNITATTWLIGAFHPLFGLIHDCDWDAFRIDQISVNVSAVPLPAAFWFLASGLVMLGFYRRRANA